MSAGGPGGFETKWEEHPGHTEKQESIHRVSEWTSDLSQPSCNTSSRLDISLIFVCLFVCSFLQSHDEVEVLGQSLQANGCLPGGKSRISPIPDTVFPTPAWSPLFSSYLVCDCRDSLPWFL